MSWPVPSGVASSGPVLPVVALPWVGREPSRPQIAIPAVHNHARSRNRKASIRKAKYGAAMVAGLMAVGLVKRIINSVPLINILTRPVLDLVPTIVVGPALGAALMYGIEEGDLMAARHVVREKAHRVRQELDVIVQDLSSEIRAEGSELARQLERSQGALESVARAVTDSVSELERTVLPATEREYRRLEAHARQAFQDVGAEGPRGRS